jgi:DNA-binding MarR family transcriptional regulator
VHNHACADLVGLNPSDWECLDVLDWTGPLTAGRLAEHVGLTSGAITGVIDRLVHAGFVRRAPDPDDRRKVVVHLLRDRDRDLGEVFTHLVAAVDELTARYTDDELAAIVDFLRGANEALADSTDRMRAAARERKAGSRPRDGPVNVA